MRSDYIFDNAEEKQLRKLLDGAFARGTQPSSLEGCSNRRSSHKRQSPRIVFKVKGESSSKIQPLRISFEVKVMTAPEVMNSSPAVDAANPLSQCATRMCR